MSETDKLATQWRSISHMLDEALLLPASERGRWLADLPAALRSTLPLVVQSDGTVRLPAFRGEPPMLNKVADSLILPRLEAACGRINSERALG